MSLHIYLSTFLLIVQSYNCMAQCRVEFMSPPATLSTTSYVQPTGQFVIPAVIKPLIDNIAQPPTVPCFPDYNCYNYPTAMSPSYVSRNDDDDWRSILYCLIFALSNRLGNGGNSCGGGCGCGGNCGFGGNCGCGGGFGFGGGCGSGGGCSCGGNFGFGGGCGCGRNNGFNGGCGCSCGGGFGFGGSCGCGGGCGCNNGCGNGGFGFDSGYCGCGGCGEINFGNGVTYIPYPIIIPTNCGSPGGIYYDPTANCDCCGQGPTLQASNGKDTNEINLRIITDSC